MCCVEGLRQAWGPKPHILTYPHTHTSSHIPPHTHLAEAALAQAGGHAGRVALAPPPPPGRTAAAVRVRGGRLCDT